MKEYPIERWHEKILNGMNIVLVNYFLSTKNFEGWVFSHELMEEPLSGVSSTVYFFKRNTNDNDEAIRIDVIENNSIKDAERTFLFLLTDVMAPMEFPEAKDENVGEICYKGFSDIDSLLMFLRGNIVIRIRSIGQKEMAVLTEAKIIDEDLINQPGEKDHGLMQLKFDISYPAEEVLKQLASNTEDASGKRVYFKIIVPDHTVELTRNGIINNGVSLPGNIILYAINEEGSVARISLK